MFEETEITDKAVEETKLPSWLNELLPEPKQPVAISYDADTKTAVNNYADGSTEVFDDIGQAYDVAESKGVGTEFSSSVEREFGLFVSIPSDRESFSRMLIPGSEVSHLNSLKYSYLAWTTGNLSWYEQSPDDFMAAYYFLDGHPCFWIKRTGGDAYDWETQGYASRLWHHPSYDDSKNVVHMMEAGAHVPGEYNQHYHDFRLDVYADSYENAIIETAALVHKFFNPNGTEREGVEYEKSQIELDLDEAAKRLEDLPLSS